MVSIITLNDIQEAGERIAPYILKTPLLRVPALDDILNCQVYLKSENFQNTGSFKIRGAMNSVLALTEEEKQRGVVASSSGNHAQGVARAAQLQGISATIVMPINANPVKLQNVKDFGATVLQVGTKSSERDDKVKEIVKKEGRVEIHPYAFSNVKSGQGTIALEILEDQPDMDVIVSPIGGGGLISGIAVGAKGIREDILIIGVEPAGASRYTISLASGKPEALDNVDTIADGTRTDKANPGNFQIIKEYVDDVQIVEDSNIRKAMKLLVEKGRIVAEPSSVMGIAAFLEKQPLVAPEDKVCFVLSGGNNDLTLLTEVLSE